MEPHSTVPESTEGYRDPTTLTNWTRWFLYASIASYLIRIWSEAGELVRGGGDGAAEGIGLDTIFLIVTGGPVWLVTGILVLVWIHRANHNARQLGAADMRFTPGWAVGWYFVPIAWFWKPYQAMTEIWRASRNPSAWRGEPVPPLLRWWWVLWIVPSWGLLILDWTAGRSLDEAGAEKLEATMGLVDWILDIPLALVMLAIIGAVHRMQTDHHRRQSAPTPVSVEERG